MVHAVAAWEPPTVLGDPHRFASTWYLPGLAGSSAWGPHDAEDIELFFVQLDWMLEHLSYPFDFLVDYARMGLGDHDWRSFGRVAAGARARMPRLARAIRRWSCVAPSHAVGLAVAGSQRLLGAPYPARAFARIEDALGWLGRADAEPLAAFLDALPARQACATSLLTRLRAVLAGCPELPLEAAAQALVISPRGLQRALVAAATSFRREQVRARAPR